jgi:hypothetical protein
MSVAKTPRTQRKTVATNRAADIAPIAYRATANLTEIARHRMFHHRWAIMKKRKSPLISHRASLMRAEYRASGLGRMPMLNEEIFIRIQHSAFSISFYPACTATCWLA